VVAPTSGTRTALKVPERFSVIQRLGIGGTSEVVEALDRTTGRVVALKLAASQHERVRQTAHEADVLRQLRHPGIVQLEADGIDGEVRWIAMERLEGVSLEVVLREHGSLPWAWVRSALIQILDALEHAHQAGVVHGDVKPANCFCSGFVDLRTPPLLKLLDFGLAEHVRDADEPGAVGFAGSAAYVAPELAAGGEATPAADLYSVGVMAHELLLGHVPFGAGGSQTVLWQQQHGPVAPLEGRAPLVDIPENALRAFDQALDKQPLARPASALALRQVLESTTEIAAHSALWRLLQRAPRDSEGVALVRLGEHVRRIWIDDYLNEARMGLVDVRQVHRWVGKAGDTTEAHALLPLFERADRSLVVLGEPGFGKTVAALKLCRALLDLRQRAQSSESTPVVIPLAAWRGTPGEVLNWLALELHSRYSLPRRLCSQMFQGRRLVLLLDGLDEVPPALRQGCVDAINALIASGDFAGVVVTCRSAEYHELTKPVAAKGCVELQRLALSDVQHRVERQGLTALVHALETNARLAELATIPLMLRLLQAVSREEFFPEWVKRGPISAEGLLDHFLEGPLSAIARSQRPADLIRVARLAVTEGQGVIRCEALQPRMLRAMWAKVSYALLGRLVVASIACFGPLLAVAYSPIPNGELVVTPRFALELSAKSALMAGVLFAAAALATGLRWGSRRASRWVNGIAAVLTLGGTATWVGIDRPPAAAIMGLEAAMLALFVLWGARAGASMVNDDVTLDRDLSFRLPSSRGALFAGLLGALWAILVLVATRTLVATAYMGGAFAAAGLLLAAMKTRRDTIAAAWNAAFWKALRSACVAAALTVAVVTVGFGPSFGFAYGACVALTFGSVVFLWLGGTDAILYVIMRLLMAVEGTLPLGSRELMTRAVSARIMKQVGPGYAFLHWKLADRLLESQSSSR